MNTFLLMVVLLGADIRATEIIYNRDFGKSDAPYEHVVSVWVVEVGTKLPGGVQGWTCVGTVRWTWSMPWLVDERQGRREVWWWCMDGRNGSAGELDEAVRLIVRKKSIIVQRKYYWEKP